MDEAVRVRNVGDEVFEASHLGKTVRIAPGEEQGWVRSEAAILWFGDPAAIDHVVGNDNNDDRTKECQRLDARYGVFPIRRDEAATTPERTRAEAWPKVQVLTMTGEEIRMVINDPDGAHVTPAASETVENRRDLMATIKDLQSRVERYEAEVARSALPPEDEAPITLDDAPASRSRGKAS